ncbi:MAG TPA: hypothetical protein H9958_02755 [Candidatus Limosilactobacillus intestinavium]|uniref:hypothetical protein n=1 Tax=Limosilactobacillus coleohominis TaxID=181675 RepID=UPI001F96DC07|nr:hypothetical protein [Limosilactobacillus coleohominis]HJA23126.1 hypothetical protein [Candidatus Limosilactobacillus intestinavium]
MQMQIWDGKPHTFKNTWLNNLKIFQEAINGYMEWMNSDIGLFNDYELNLDLTLPDGFGRNRRLKIMDQMKVIRKFLLGVEKMLNESSYQEYDDDGNAVPYKLAVEIFNVPLTNDAKNYNALFKELERDINLLSEFRDANGSN